MKIHLSFLMFLFSAPAWACGGDNTIVIVSGVIGSLVIAGIGFLALKARFREKIRLPLRIALTILIFLGALGTLVQRNLDSRCGPPEIESNPQTFQVN